MYTSLLDRPPPFLRSAVLPDERDGEGWRTRVEQCQTARINKIDKAALPWYNR